VADRALYTAKCFWPGVSVADVRAAAARAGASFRGALLFDSDDLVLCLFETTSRSSAKAASEQAGMPCERVIETVWVERERRNG
jgi:hypothetical protein